MEFHEQLSAYMDEYNISVHELAVFCGKSDALISRYKNGSRAPQWGSDIVVRISDAIATLSVENLMAEAYPPRFTNSL